jgi:hypothetical protein
LVINNQQPEPIEASLPQKEIPNNENHIGFASLQESPMEAPISISSEEPNPNLFKAVPDNILNLIPTYTEVNQETKQEEQEPISNPFERNPNFYARWSLAFGLIGFFYSNYNLGTYNFWNLSHRLRKKIKAIQRA